MLTRKEVEWAYRILLDRECESASVAKERIENNTLKTLREELIASPEYWTKNRRVARFFGERSIVIKELKWARLYIDLSDSIGMQLAIGEGVYDPGETNFIMTSVKKGHITLDLGAHMGYYTMLFASLVGASGKVFAFEPQKSLYELLQKSVEENNYTDRVIAINACVANRTGAGEMGMHIGPGDYGTSHLINKSGTKYTDQQIKTVNLAALKDCDFQKPINFIKLDIEGAEFIVLKDFREKIRIDKPIILSEINTPLLSFVSKVSAKEYIEEIMSYGYSCYELTPEGKLGGEFDDTKSEVQNAVFLPIKCWTFS